MQAYSNPSYQKFIEQQFSDAFKVSDFPSIEIGRQRVLIADRYGNDITPLQEFSGIDSIVNTRFIRSSSNAQDKNE